MLATWLTRSSSWSHPVRHLMVKGVTLARSAAHDAA
jgi:hypothetical protein